MVVLSAYKSKPNNFSTYLPTYIEIVYTKIRLLVIPTYKLHVNLLTL